MPERRSPSSATEKGLGFAPLWPNGFLRVFFFLWLPLFGGWAILFGVLQASESSEREGVREQLKKEARNLMIEVEPERFFFEYFSELGRKILSQKTSGDLSALLERESAQDPDNMIEWCVFNRAGELVVTNTRYLKEIERLWRFLYREETPDDGPHSVEYRHFFGKDFPWRSILERPCVIRPIFGRQGDGVLWYQPGAAGTREGILFIAWDTPSPVLLIRRRLREHPVKTDYVLVRAPDGETSLLQGGPEKIVSERSFSFQNELLPGPDSRESMISSGSASVTELVSVSRQVRDNRLELVRCWKAEHFRRRSRGLSGTLVIGTIFVVLLAIRLCQNGAGVFFSIRFKLLGLFLYAVLLPVLGLETLAHRHLQEHRHILIEKTTREITDVLAGIDNDFVNEREQVLRYFRALRDDPRTRSDHESMKQLVIEADHQHQLNWFEARDMKACLLFSTERPEVTREIGQVARVIAKTLIDRFLQDRVSAGGKGIALDPAEVITQSVIESPMTGWSRILNMPDQLHDVQMGDFAMLWYWDIIRDPSHPAALVQANFKIQHLIGRFLNRILTRTRFAVQHGALRVSAWEAITDRHYPESLEAEPGRSLLFRLAKLENDIVYELLPTPAGEYLAVAVPGKNLRGVFLTGLFPMSEIERPLAEFRWNVLLGILLAVALACLIGVVLGETLLVPIGHLLFGVRALHERQTDVSLPALGDDELGDLAQIFNGTLNALKDILFARAIQGKLIPQTVSSPPGYDLALMNLPCRDLGGDYCDAIPCRGSGLLIAIGDVTGHGVGSALVTAMAKYGIMSFARHDRPVTDLMVRLNRILLHLLCKKKVMTFFAALLEPASGKVVFSNAGHPLPVLFRRDGTREKLEICRAPLGFSERSPFEEQETTIRFGDVLVFFTDGMFEMRNDRGEPWGLPRFLATVERYRNEPAGVLRDRVIEELRAHAGSAEFDDDITLLVLKRNA